MPGHDPERHAGGGQRQRLLAATAEHERIAALEAQHAPPAPARRSIRRWLIRSCAEPLRPARLPTGSKAAAALASARIAGVDQGVVQDHVGALERVGGVQREQVGIARPGADQPDAAGRELRQGEARAHAAPPAKWMPHSVLSRPHQRPARGASPAPTGRVQVTQPIER